MSKGKLDAVRKVNQRTYQIGNRAELVSGLLAIGISIVQEILEAVVGLATPAILESASIGVALGSSVRRIVTLEKTITNSSRE